MPEDHQADFIDAAALARQAHAAIRAGDAARSLAAWAALRAHAPENTDALAGMGHALMRLGRIDEAEALAVSAAGVHATALVATTLRARIAERRRDWDAALGYWREVAEHAPDAPEAWIGASQALCRLGRPSDADALLDDGLRHQPGSKTLLAGLCRVAETAQDWPEALRRWTALRDLQPGLPDAAAGIARALHGQGRLDAAEAAAMAVMRRFPAHPDAHVIYARVAMARPDWPEAARRWAAAEQRFPMHPAVAGSRAFCEARARTVAGDFLPSAEASPIDILAPQSDWRLDRSDTAAVANFLMQFESLGSQCEFGLVQRKFGAEPLGLLRWSNMQPPWLIQALAARFAGVGTPEQTSIIMLRDEYGAQDQRFKFGIHLGIKSGESTPERVLKSQCRRIAFLRDKLLAELDGQEKIFVYVSHKLTDSDVAAIVGLLSDYGPNLLLCVRASTPSHPPGSVHVASDRLVVGYTAQAALERRGAGWNINFDDWLTFCEAAWRLWAEVRGQKDSKEAVLF
jgi:tetratricopeptide (TPR) repeat protein